MGDVDEAAEELDVEAVAEAFAAVGLRAIEAVEWALTEIAESLPAAIGRVSDPAAPRVKDVELRPALVRTVPLEPRPRQRRRRR